MTAFLKTKIAGVFLILLFLGFAIYANSLNNEFLLDDGVSLKFPYVSDQFSVKTIWEKISTRFIPYVSFGLSYRLSGFDPTAYRAVNIFIHVVNSFLVFLLGIVLFRKIAWLKPGASAPGFMAALGSGLLFLVHPLQTEAVGYISQRISLFYVFFYLSAFLAYLQFRLKSSDWKWYLAALFFFCGAVLSKENSVTFPLMAAFCEILLGALEGRKIRPKNFCAIIPFALLSLAVPLLLKYNLVNGREGLTAASVEYFGVSRLTYFLSEMPVLCRYLQMLVVPYPQTLSHPNIVYQSFLDPVVLAAAFGLFALAASSVFFCKRYPLYFFFVFWFLISLSVESTFFPIGKFMVERRLYLPMAGFSVFALDVIFRCVSSARIRAAVLAGVLMVFSLLTVNRNALWKSCETIFKEAVDLAPDKAFDAYYFLHFYYSSKGDFENADAVLEKAIRHNPTGEYALSLYMRHIAVLIDQKRYREGALELEKLVSQYLYVSLALRLAELYFLDKDYGKAFQILAMNMAGRFQADPVSGQIHAPRVYGDYVMRFLAATGNKDEALAYASELWKSGHKEEFAFVYQAIQNSKT